jgi:hypothetical protein
MEEMSQPQPWACDRGKGLQGYGPRRRHGSHITCSRECQRVWGYEPSHSQVNSHCRSWSPKWTPKILKHNFRGQNPSSWSVLYITRKLLKHRCLKWARIAHLDIWNTSYGQNKGRGSNWQFDSRPLQVRNRPNFLMCRWRATYRWKAID